MIDWIKSLGVSVWVAMLAAAAAYAATTATRNKRSERIWQAKAQDYKRADRDESLKKAEAALERAALANERAEKAKEKTQKRLTAIAGKDDEMADIIDRWSNTDRMRD